MSTDFDERLRRVHAQSLDHVSPRTRVQLRPQRASTHLATSRRHVWPLAATCAIALVAGGIFLRHPERIAPMPTQSMPGPNTSASADSRDDTGTDIYTALDESPELYLWLASNDTDNLVTE